MSTRASRRREESARGEHPRDARADVPVIPVVLAVSVLALLLGLANLLAGSADSDPPPTPLTITVAAQNPGPTIPSSFLGLSLEYSAIPAYAGTDPASPDPVFVQLVRNLTPGQRPVLRIGGDSSDWTWWPVPGVTRPPGVTYTLGPAWNAIARGLSRALRARLILGLNLEAGNPELAAVEASALNAGAAPGSVFAFELGNEPELYGLFPWYRTSSGHGIPGRPPTYGFDAFLADIKRFVPSLPAVPLAGPTTGGERFFPRLGEFLAAVPRLALVTVHHYPLQLCFSPPAAPRHPSLDHLLSPAAETGLAAGFATAVATAHRRGLPLRIDELNTVSCGAAPAVSRTFGSALWALDTLFAFARVGVDGVNVHTFPGAGYELFHITRSGGQWNATVWPEYYGLLMFALAAPPGSRLLGVRGASGTPLAAWATRGADGRIRVVLINQAATGARRVFVRFGAATANATLLRLTAPGLASATGATLGGRSIAAQSRTGRLDGTPATSSVTASGGAYTITVPAGSAALLTAGSSLPPARG